jgi:hypothetical protein
METLKNLTLMQWIGIAIGLNSLFMGATPQLTVLFGANAVPYIVALATLGNGALGVFVTVIGGQSAQIRNVLAMPGVEKIDVNGQANSALATLAVDPNQNKIGPTPAAMDKVVATAKAAAVVLLAIALSAISAPASFAAAKPAAAATGATPSKCALVIDPLNLCGVLTGNIQTDVQRVAKRLAAVSKADLNYAMAKAKAAGSPASKIRLQCVQAISDAVDQVNGVGLKNQDGTDMARPDPALVTMIEDVAELVDNLSPQGTLLTSCAGAAQMLGMNGLQAVNAIITGTATFAALPVGL